MNVIAFVGDRRVAEGDIATVATQLWQGESQRKQPLLVFDLSSARVVDLNLQGGEQEVAARYQQANSSAPQPPKGPGRPKLGVKAKEVTLLPRHWQWLSAQPGGASASLRKLVEQAMRQPNPKGERVAAQERCDRFMQVMAGNQPGYEEAARALYAGNQALFEEHIALWPEDISQQLRLWAGPAFAAV